MQPNETPNQEPVISEDEMKVPETAVPVASQASEPSSMPIVLGVIIVLLVLILAGLYLWGTTMMPSAPDMNDTGATRPTAAENNEPESDTADAQVEMLETVSTSNSLDAIEADIESTNLDSIDTELGTIDAELDATATTGAQQ